MSIGLWKTCAILIVLSICTPITYALLVNESVSTRSSDVARSLQRKGEIAMELATDTGEPKEEEEEEEKEEKNCTDRSINDFPEDLFTSEERRHGAVVLHAFLSFYCFVMTAIVCHDYLLPAVDLICQKMNISTDIAGATFLAMASSFPEMFVNVIGTFLTETDLGAGTVVGSAVFDTFATPACGALLTLHAIPLEWRILSRDCTMYVISVATLVAVMWDGVIRWYEAAALILLLCFYIILLFSGKYIVSCCRKTACFDSDSTAKLPNVYHISIPESSQKSDRAQSSRTCELEKQVGEASQLENRLAEESMERPVSERLFRWPTDSTTIAKFWFMLTWPLRFLLFVTIPDARQERWKRWYPLTFLMCVVWIAIISYLVSWMMTVIGDTIGIPDSIMGLTFLAAGGNMPEVASIAILARQGDGNMAMSNTLGANILDILLCLGLPWMIKCLMTGKDVHIVSGALTYSVLSIIACIVILYGVIAFFKFNLNKRVGLVCLLVYAIFLVFAILVELNVFAPVNLPMCP